MPRSTSNADRHEAHVQVLTAEVRTLVVGSRQVTMSVYNQLDNVSPSEIEPFGRVTPKEMNGVFIFVVGRHRTTGALVRSYAPRHPERLDRSGYLEFGPYDRRFYMHWPRGAKRELDQDTAEECRQQLARSFAEWSALPLIVLAGLR